MSIGAPLMHCELMENASVPKRRERVGAEGEHPCRHLLYVSNRLAARSWVYALMHTVEWLHEFRLIKVVTRLGHLYLSARSEGELITLGRHDSPIAAFIRPTINGRLHQRRRRGQTVDFAARRKARWRDIYNCQSRSYCWNTRSRSHRTADPGEWRS